MSTDSIFNHIVDVNKPIPKSSNIVDIICWELPADQRLKEHEYIKYLLTCTNTEKYAELFKINTYDKFISVGKLINLITNDGCDSFHFT